MSAWSLRAVWTHRPVGSLPRRAARGSHEVVNRGPIQLVTRSQIAESLKENRSSGVFIDGERDQAL